MATLRVPCWSPETEWWDSSLRELTADSRIAQWQYLYDLDFQLLRSYHAHSASISAISVSPFPLPRLPRDASPAPSIRSGISAAPRARPVFVATSSVDGHVCVQSLNESRDVTLRGFGRPVQATGISPEYSVDRSYLSGGLAGELILTNGVQTGTRSVASTASQSAVASGWLGSIGIGASTGKDEVLHSGEGAISTIKWSRSTKYVAWVNEHGIKLMRSNLKLTAQDAALAWKRISHIDHPHRPGWEAMAGAWKAHIEWIDQEGLEVDTISSTADHGVERLIGGWSGTVWIVNVKSANPGAKQRAGIAEIITILRIDAIISGLTMYTENLLVVLAYIPKADSRKRGDAQPAEIRIINIDSKEEIAVAEPVMVDRYQKLSAMDYHLAVLPIARDSGPSALQKGTLDTLTNGLTTIGDGLWDATMYSTKLLGSAIHLGQGSVSEPVHPARPQTSLGMKIFIHSPYDCVVASKPTPMDHFYWLEAHDKFEEAWIFLNDCPVSQGNASMEPSDPETTSEDEVQNVQLSVGQKWMQQLVLEGNWAQAGQIAGKVLGGSSAWSFWVREFAQAGRIDAIADSIPDRTTDIVLPAIVYELVLKHYLNIDRPRAGALFNAWPEEGIAADALIAEIEMMLKRQVTENGDPDWRILHQILAKLYMKAGKAREALRCQICLHDSGAAMQLIKEHHLVAAIADNVPGFLRLQVHDESDFRSLAEITAEPIRLLVAEASLGTVPSDVVVRQLKDKYKGSSPYLYFYLRALWTGSSKGDEGRSIVALHANEAVENFAKYDRPLLMEFLRANQTYDLAHASKICRQYPYAAELVLLLAKEGRLGDALRLIIDDLGDIGQAIEFAKEQDDLGLWEDLLGLSMQRPAFIAALLQDIGTAIDPLKIVQGIPMGMEIPGLRPGLLRILRDYELQDSIARGTARIMAQEINAAVVQRGRGYRQALKFDPKHKFKCGLCQQTIEGIAHFLITFPCRHIFHLTCLGKIDPHVFNAENGWSSEMGPKMDRTRLVTRLVKNGCPLEAADHGD